MLKKRNLPSLLFSSLSSRAQIQKEGNQQRTGQSYRRDAPDGKPHGAPPGRGGPRREGCLPYRRGGTRRRRRRRRNRGRRGRRRRGGARASRPAPPAATSVGVAAPAAGVRARARRLGIGVAVRRRVIQVLEERRRRARPGRRSIEVPRRRLVGLQGRAGGGELLGELVGHAVDVVLLVGEERKERREELVLRERGKKRQRKKKNERRRKKNSLFFSLSHSSPAPRRSPGPPP